MASTLTRVRQASVSDVPRLLRLLDTAARHFTSIGREDLRYLLSQDRVWLADGDDRLSGFLCVTPRSSPAADLRALALINGWSADAGVQALLEPVIGDLKDVHVTELVCLSGHPWLRLPLQRSGFDLVDGIVYFERTPCGGFAADPNRETVLRSARGHDLPTLLELDSQALETLWRFDKGHFMELMVTSEHCMVAEQAGRAVGYAITDLRGDAGFIVRLAVHPDRQGQGIGSLLLEDALSYCHTAGAAVVRLNTQESNAVSHRLYLRYSFQRWGRRVPVFVKQL